MKIRLESVLAIPSKPQYIQVPYKILCSLVIGLCYLCLLASCSNQIPNTTETTVAATPESVVNIRPGVITANDYRDLPLPTSGYDLYVVGEPHGEKEVHELTFKYLEALYENAGLRTIIIEQINPRNTSDVNDYVLGARNTMLSKWSHSADLLTIIRNFNDGLPEEEKVHVYLPDLDYTFSSIYAHLLILHEEVASGDEDIEIPSLAELGAWDEEELLVLLSRLVKLAGDRDDVIADLETVGDSIRWHFITRKFDNGEMTTREFVNYEYIREVRISLNIQHLLDDRGDAPVLALYGGFHVQKYPALAVSVFDSDLFLLDSPSWVQRTVEAGVDVFSVFAMGITGQSGLPGYLQPVDRNAEEIRFSDGATAAGLFADNPDNNILYIDLRMEENRTLRLGNNFSDIPAGDIFDSVVLFWEVHPQVGELEP